MYTFVMFLNQLHICKVPSPIIFIDVRATFLFLNFFIISLCNLFENCHVISFIYSLNNNNKKDTMTFHLCSQDLCYTITLFMSIRPMLHCNTSPFPPFFISILLTNGKT